MVKEKLKNIGIYFVYVILFIILLIYILYGSKVVMNSDSAFFVDYSLEQLRLHQVFPLGWNESNDFWIYSLIPMITLFLKSGLNLFLARQFTVVVQTAILFVLLYSLCGKEMKCKKEIKIIGLIFVSGISSQMLFEVFGDATYGSIILYILSGVWLFSKYINKEKKVYLVLLASEIILLVMCSMRFAIYLVGPMIFSLVALWYEDRRKKYIIIGIILLLSVVIGLELNKVLIENLSYIRYFVKSVTENQEGLITNFESTVFNLFWIGGATNKATFSLTVTHYLDIKADSPKLLFLMVRCIYVIVTIALPFILAKKYKKFTKIEKVVYIFIVSMFGILCFFNIIAAMSSWYRYLIPVWFFLNILYVLFYKYYVKDNLSLKVVFSGLLVIFILFSVYMNIFTYYSFKDKKLKSNPYQEVADFLVEQDLSFGYIGPTEESSVFRLITNGKLQVCRVEIGDLRPNKWINSNQWYKSEYYKGKTFFIRNIQKPEEIWEKDAIERIQFKDNYIFIFESNEEILKQYIIK